MLVYTPSGFVEASTVKVGDVVYTSQLKLAKVVKVVTKYLTDIKVHFNTGTSVILSTRHALKGLTKKKPYIYIDSLLHADFTKNGIDTIPSIHTALLSLPFSTDIFYGVSELMKTHGYRCRYHYVIEHRCPLVLDVAYEMVNLLGWFAKLEGDKLYFNTDIKMVKSTRKYVNPVLARKGKAILSVKSMGVRSRHYYITVKSPVHEIIIDGYTIIKDYYKEL